MDSFTKDMDEKFMSDITKVVGIKRWPLEVLSVEWTSDDWWGKEFKWLLPALTKAKSIKVDGICTKAELRPLKGNNNLRPLEPLKNLTTLTLDATNSFNITEDILTALLSEATKLESLFLWQFNGSNLKKALKKIYETHKFPSLNRFDLYRVNRLTLEDLLPMIEDSDNPLKQVSISYCDDISEEDIKHYKRRVKNLDIKVAFTKYR